MPDTTILPTQIDIMKFLFSERRILFNTRREREWKVLFGFVALLAALDASQLTYRVQLTQWWLKASWIVVVILLTFSALYYQVGLQRRNAADRKVLNELKKTMWERVGLQVGHPAMLQIEGVVSIEPRGLWAFWPQVLIAVLLSLLSCAIPLIHAGDCATQL